MSAGNLEWVLVRGLTREAGHWGSFSEYLVKAFPGSKVSTLDLLGAGVRYSESAPLRISDYVEALHRELHRENQKPVRRVLVTLSMASMVALEWMKRHPEVFEGAVLINGSASSMSPPYRRLRPGAYPKLLRAALSWGLERRERAILELTSNMREARDQAHPSWVQIARTRPVSLPNAFRQLYAAARFRPPTFKPRSRLLFLNSRGDRMVHPSCSEALHRAFGGDLQSHENAGHDLPLDAPTWVVERIRTWSPA